MKTSTLIILAIAGVGVVYIATRPKAAALPYGTGSSSSTNSLLGQLGALAGGFIVGSGGNISRPLAAGAGGSGGSGDSEVAIVKGLDSTNIDAYDAQGDVYGIAGIDYPL